jgi:PIN domain nuclease of toxin-antitoxin system
MILRILLDTHVLVWALGQRERLTPDGIALIEDTAHDVYFSAVSIWEIAIKARLRKPGFDIDPRALLQAARATEFVELPVTATDASRVAELPRLHGDPFDHLLIAQALQMPARFLTADNRLTAYSELVTVV